MCSTFATRPLTWTGSRGTHYVRPHCMWPGDDNYRNWEAVSSAEGLKAKMEMTCRRPRMDPLDPTRALVKCNRGWVIDSKAVSNQIGQGPWVSNLPNPCGRCMCTRPKIRGRDIDNCRTEDRASLLSQAALSAHTWRAEGASADGLPLSMLSMGFIAQLITSVQYFVLRVARLHTTFHHALKLLPAGFGAISTAIQLARSAETSSDSLNSLLNTAKDSIRPLVKGGRVKEGARSLAGLSTACVGSAEPIKKLSRCLTKLNGKVDAALSEGGDPTRLRAAVAALDNHGCVAALEQAKTAVYWKKHKVRALCSRAYTCTSHHMHTHAPDHVRMMFQLDPTRRHSHRCAHADGVCSCAYVHFSAP